MKKLTLAMLFISALSFAQTPNMVRVEARHCAKYATYNRHGKVKVDQAACNADQSTLYYTNYDHNLRTYAGLDFASVQLAGAASAVNVAAYIGLSSDSTAPAQTDTVLAGELSTNGLARALGTYAHSACNSSACTFTITKVFTDSGSATSNIQKAAVFTQSSAGTMVYENTFPVVTLNPTDSLTVSWTVNLS